MFRRTEVDIAADQPTRPTPPDAVVMDPPWPNFSGDLDTILGRGPLFRRAVRGYDRLQVDNYVAWADSELRAARRETDDLVARFGRCSAELEISRRLLAQSPSGQEMTHVSERIGTMLQLAADEAAALTAAGAAEAETILANARTEADARLRKGAEIKQRAVEAGDRMREEARRARAEATTTLQAAQEEAARLLAEAAAERERLDREAAQARQQAEAAAAAQLAEVEGHIEELGRRRERAREALVRLDDQIGVALETVSGLDDVVLAGEPRHRAAS